MPAMTAGCAKRHDHDRQIPVAQRPNRFDRASRTRRIRGLRAKVPTAAGQQRAMGNGLLAEPAERFGPDAVRLRDDAPVQDVRHELI